MSSAGSRRVVVAAVGSEFRGDDAAGPAVLDRVGELKGVDMLGALASPLDLLGAWDGADLAIVVDAVEGIDAPGGVCIIDVDMASAPGVSGRTRSNASSHGLGVIDALRIAGAMGTAPERVLLVGVSGEDFDAGCRAQSGRVTCSGVGRPTGRRARRRSDRPGRGPMLSSRLRASRPPRPTSDRVAPTGPSALVRESGYRRHCKGHRGGGHEVPRSGGCRSSPGRGGAGRRHRRGRRGRSGAAARRRPGGLRSRPGAFGAPRRHRGAEAGGALPARAGHGCHRRGRSAGRERRGPAYLWPRCFRRGDGRASRAPRAGAACPRVPGWSPAGGPPRALCRHRRRRHRHGINGPCRLSGRPRPWGGSCRARGAGRLALCGDGTPRRLRPDAVRRGSRALLCGGGVVPGLLADNGRSGCRASPPRRSGRWRPEWARPG